MQRNTHLITKAYKLLITAALLLSVTSVTANAQNPLVKMNNSKICHDTSSPYYKRTRNFKAYDSITACLDAGDQLPKGQKTPNLVGHYIYTAEKFQGLKDRKSTRCREVPVLLAY